MSEVRRYEFDENGVCYHQPDGPFVSYDDYASLKAEVERLQKLVGMQESIDKAINAWIESKTAAKEGKPSV